MDRVLCTSHGKLHEKYYYYYYYSISRLSQFSFTECLLLTRIVVYVSVSTRQRVYVKNWRQRRRVQGEKLLRVRGTTRLRLLPACQVYNM